MKAILIHILRVVLYPFYTCYRIVQDAPIPNTEDALIGFSAYSRYTAADAPRTPARADRMHPVLR